MSQHDLVLDNASGASFRSDANNALQALGTRQSGASAPSTTYAHMLWVDTTNGVVKRRNAANSAWIVVATNDETFVLARSSNTMLDVSDREKTIVATSTFTQTLDAAATLGDGWWVRYRNDGTGLITIDPNSTETIDGATTIHLGPGQSCTIVCNGAAFYTVGGGTLVLLQTQLASAASTVDFTRGIDGKYSRYILTGSGVTVSNDNVGLYLRGSTDGGSSFLSTGIYNHAAVGRSSDAATITAGTAADTVIILQENIGNATGEHCSFEFSLHNLDSTSLYKGVHGTTHNYSIIPNTGIWVRGGTIITASAINALRILVSAGTFSGTFSLYGVKK